MGVPKLVASESTDSNVGQGGGEEKSQGEPVGLAPNDTCIILDQLVGGHFADVAARLGVEGENNNRLTPALAFVRGGNIPNRAARVAPIGSSAVEGT